MSARATEVLLIVLIAALALVTVLVHLDNAIMALDAYNTIECYLIGKCA